VPSYLAVLSNRPVAEIADQETLRKLQIGLNYFLLPQRIGPDVADAARDYGLLYGMATALMALLIGWFASVVFRRD
jgi:tetrahydromethanopterin S-methyltransferase subunit G